VHWHRQAFGREDGERHLQDPLPVATGIGPQRSARPRASRIGALGCGGLVAVLNAPIVKFGVRDFGFAITGGMSANQLTNCGFLLRRLHISLPAFPPDGEGVPAHARAAV